LFAYARPKKLACRDIRSSPSGSLESHETAGIATKLNPSTDAQLKDKPDYWRFWQFPVGDDCLTAHCAETNGTLLFRENVGALSELIGGTAKLFHASNTFHCSI
jgi:hypothetical protein